MFTHKTQKFIRFGVNILRKRIDLKTEFKVNIFFLRFHFQKTKCAFFSFNFFIFHSAQWEYYINSIFMRKLPKTKETKIAFLLKTEKKMKTGKEPLV